MKSALILSFASVCALVTAGATPAGHGESVHWNKDIFIPKIITPCDSVAVGNWEGWNPRKWSFSRMLQGENVALFWAPLKRLNKLNSNKLSRFFLFQLANYWQMVDFLLGIDASNANSQ